MSCESEADKNFKKQLHVIKEVTPSTEHLQKILGYKDQICKICNKLSYTFGTYMGVEESCYQVVYDFLSSKNSTICLKSTDKEDKSRVDITFTKHGKISVCVTPKIYGSDEQYFINKDITFDDVMNEMGNFSHMLDKGMLPPASKLKKITYNLIEDERIPSFPE